MSRKIINPSSKILCKLKLCVCDNGTYAEDSLNCSYSCSSSVLVIQWYSLRFQYNKMTHYLRLFYSAVTVGN